MFKSAHAAKRNKISGKPAPYKPLRGFELWLVKQQCGSSLRMRIYEKLSKFVTNGVPITQALQDIQLHMSQDGKKPRTVAALVLNEWRQQMLNGNSFARAVVGWATSAELSLLEAGEMAGRLDVALENVIYLNSANKRIRGALMGLMYPLVLVATTCLYLYIFGIQVVPAFTMVLPVDEWTGAGRSLAKLADFVQNGLLHTLLGAGLLITLIVSTFGRWTGRVRQYFDRVPPWSVYRLVTGAGFLISLSALLQAGVSVPDALRIIANNAPPWYRERLLATRQLVLNGARNIGDALNKTGYNFPSWDSVIDIRSYAALDGFEDMLDKLSRQWLEDSVQAISTQMDALRNVSIVLMGVLFMWIISGMFALQQQISSAAH